MYEHTGTTFYQSWVEGLLKALRTVDLAPGPGGSRMSEDAATRPIIEAALIEEDFPGPPWSYVTMVALYPGAQLPAHVDAPISGTRFHIPLQLNAGCWVFSEGVWQQLNVGSVYTMDPTKPHGAVNWGETLRLHLLIDAAHG